MESGITVKTIDDSSSQPELVRLNFLDNLLIIREQLERRNIMNEALSFAHKFSNNSDEFAEITLEDEENFLLRDIINEKILYLKQSSKISWKYLNDLCQLDYGRTMTFDGIKKANKRAFEMKNCELSEIGAKGCKKGIVEFNSNEDWMMKENLFFNADTNVQNFVTLGMSNRTSKNENFNAKTNSSYHFTKYGKVSLKFSKYLEPTQDFIKAVEDAIKSKNPKNFKQITEEFGQFIPTEVILGGRAHFSEHIISTGYSAENSEEIVMNANTEVLEARVTNTSNYFEGKSSYYNSQCAKLIGGKQPDSLENFEEAAWVKSLSDYKNWNCIEFKNPISIFQLLPDDLCKQVIKLVGKRIHYTTTEDFNYQLEESGRPKIFELKNVPPNISKIIQNKDADCNIFATVIDTMDSKNDFFNCQVLYPPNRVPSLIIHCIQKKFKKHKYKLKIGWMVIGYDIEFNFVLSDFNIQLNILKNDFNSSNSPTMINTELLSFEYDSYVRKAPPCLGIPVLNKLDSSISSLVIGHHFFNAQQENKIGLCTFSYCLKKNCYVNLPSFTFHTLIISNYPVPNAYDTIPFNYSLMSKPYINLDNDLNPKFISLYSTQETNCGPIFLKQQSRKIKIKSINCENKTCFICTNKSLNISENNIMCALFDPFIGYEKLFNSYDISTSTGRLSPKSTLPNADEMDDEQDLSIDTTWIKQSIEEENINYYEYNEFDNIEEMNCGLTEVYRANWKQSEKCVALKLFNFDNTTVKEIVYEIKLSREVDSMINFYGITKTDSDDYVLVTEYAEGGTLHHYLKENFPSLTWHDKYRLALQLSSAIECLHKKEIVHNDLHSNNILIQQNSIKLADFGLSKRIKNTSKISLSSFDTIPYNDPEGFEITREKPQDVNLPGEVSKTLKKTASEGVKFFFGTHENFLLKTRKLFSRSPRNKIEKYKLNEKCDVYGVGVLFWELSSGKKPFADKEYNLVLATEIVQGLREGIVVGTPEEYSNLYTKCWDGDPDKRPTIQEVVIILKSMILPLNTTRKQIIQQFKLNHGLFLDGCSIEPSKQAIFLEDGELNISLYEGQPLVYTFINDYNSRTNLLSFNLDDNNISYSKALQPSDICINFPIAEITYNADYLESFSNFKDSDEASYEIYGHFFTRKIFIGGKLFIDFESGTLKQIDSFKSLLTRMYNSAKYDKENLFSNLSVVKYFPKITTLDRKDLDTLKKLTDWMKNLYQNNMVDIISYNSLNPISDLRFHKFSEDTSLNEKQPGIANFKEKLSLEEWVKSSTYYGRWVKEFDLFQGLIINKHFELETSKKIAANFINIPNVYSSDKIYYLKMMKPTTNLEEFLISNNMDIHSSLSVIKNVSKSEPDGIETIKPTTNLEVIFPFIKRAIELDNLSRRDYTHFLVKYQQYRILSNILDIKPSEEFKKAVEKALENMKPFKHLQNVFYEYGHFFPLSIVLGKSFKNILLSSSFSEHVDLQSPTFDILKPHLDKLSASYLLSQKGDIVEKTELPDWFRNASNGLEIIEFGNIISLYDILEVEQRKKIESMQDDFKIIMTGIVDLKELDINNKNHYKRISVEPSLEDVNYEVFGSIISKDNSKIEDFFVTFGLYGFNGFSAMIKSLKDTNINLKECYILWMIVGNPSKLSVFSPHNRELQVNYCTKESVTLHPDNPCYPIKTSCQLSQGDIISVNIYCSTTNYDIKFVGWSKNCINFQIQSIYNNSNLNNSHTIISDSDDDINSSTNDDNTNSSTNLTNSSMATIIDVRICVLSSNYKSLKVDNEERERHLSLIGYTLKDSDVTTQIGR